MSHGPCGLLPPLAVCIPGDKVDRQATINVTGSANIAASMVTKLIFFFMGIRFFQIKLPVSISPLLPRQARSVLSKNFAVVGQTAFHFDMQTGLILPECAKQSKPRRRSELLFADVFGSARSFQTDSPACSYFLRSNCVAGLLTLIRAD